MSLKPDPFSYTSSFLGKHQRFEYDQSEGESPPTKRRKINEDSLNMSDEEGDFNVFFPDQIYLSLLNYLSVYDFLNFSSISKTMLSDTKRIYEKIVHESHFNFSGSYCKRGPVVARVQYIFGRALCNYLEARFVLDKSYKTENPPIEKVLGLYKRFELIMTRFPSSLGAYIWADLNSLADLGSVSKKGFKKKQLKALKAGDHLLEGLSSLTLYIQGEREQRRRIEDVSSPSPFPQLNSYLSNFTSAYHSLEKAIELGATCAAQLAIRKLQVLGWDVLSEQSVWLLAKLANEKGNYYGYQQILFEDHKINVEEIYAKGERAPPILIAVAYDILLRKESNFQQAETLFDEAIRRYNGRCPADVLITAAHLKMRLTKWEEASLLLDQALQNSPIEISIETWKDASLMASSLGNKEEEEKYRRRYEAAKTES